LEKIKWVEIENFRSFSKLKIEGLGDVNIIVGKNNTGKSTFLEALFLSINHQIAPSILRSTLKTLFGKRGISLPSGLFSDSEEKYESLKSFIETFFFHGVSTASISTSLGKLKIESQGYLGFSVSEFIKDIKDEDIKRVFSKELSDSLIIEKFVIGDLAEILFLELKKEKTEEALQEEFPFDIQLQGSKGIVILNYERNPARVKNISFKNYKFLVDSSLLCSRFPTTSIWKTLVKVLEGFLSPDLYTNLKTAISPFFSTEVKSIYPSISDVYIATEHEKIPFSLVGDGIKNLALNLISLNFDKPTYVFLEEPETFLHPKMIDVLSKEIVHSGKRNQIFLTTHSLEFVENLLYYARKRKDVDVKVIGFYDLVDGKLDYEIYSEEQAYTIVNKLGEDIR